MEIVHEEEDVSVQKELKGKKLSWQKLIRNDSFDIESSRVGGHHAYGQEFKVCTGWSVILKLAFQSIGIVYGDIGTSPLYVYSSTFTDGIRHNDDILGVLSLIFYTITLIPLIKYVFIVLKANDNGQGGTFAMYSLLCRYASVGLIPNEQVEDTNISKLEVDSRRLWIRSRLENSNFAKYSLLLLSMLGTSMLIGDGIFTPCISVLSAVEGIKEATPAMTQDRVVWISIVILIGLFMVQRFGTHKVGYTFSPILLLWFVLIGGIGVYNLIKFDLTIVKALNPYYIVAYFTRNKKEAWLSLGGIVLCITGAEALFADVGHFTVRSIQISTCAITYPAIILAYAGQSAFLRKHPDAVSDIFFKSIPGPLYWPMFVLAVMAAIIASQSLISGTFSVIQQSISLGCFPRVEIVHTSEDHKGQVYIPEVNYLLMVACVAVTLSFKNTVQLGYAYGLAVVVVMTITSCILVLIMAMIWKTHILVIILYIVTIGAIELVYLTSVLHKFGQGGYLPIVFAAIIVAIMFVWHDVSRRKYNYEFQNKISPQMINDIVVDTRLTRMPGIALFHSEFVQGIPPIFKHYVQNVPALHSILVFVSSKSLPISKVPPEERFLFRRVQPKELNMFRCVARYGYRDSHHKESQPFEEILLDKLKDFITNKSTDQESMNDDDDDDGDGDEVEILEKAFEDHGVVHLMEETQLFAGAGANLAKTILINYAYNLLEKNISHAKQAYNIPHNRKVIIGMTYEL
ncbi:potassium transporter 5-like [Humulus lupulus]|uniref:potassium transporter 5-like n=1 Tax=Humulus lupulus TaxID=3486 RepID=UPI002B401A6E|nr:potassium transporter 5-like [Humulus lupulus]